MNDREARRRGWLGFVAGVALLSGAAPAATLTAAQQDGYFVWLHSLEATIAARAASGQPEQRLVFPHGLLPAVEAAEPPADGGLLTVARALAEIESRPRLLQEPSRRTTLHALGRARSYVHLAEYDSALVWYAEAAARDTSGEYARELGLEAMVTAVAANDSLAVTHRALGLLGGADLAARTGELELAYRFFVGRADSVNLDLVVRKAAAHPELLQGRIAYWQAFALSWLGRHAESLAALAGLVAEGGLSYGLDESQRAWVLVAIPDLLWLGGAPAEAEPLYRALAASTVPEASDWGACQAAALDFLDGRYLAAGTVFERLCGQNGNLPWRDYACQMAALSDELARSHREGESHGTAACYQR